MRRTERTLIVIFISFMLLGSACLPASQNGSPPIPTSAKKVYPPKSGIIPTPTPEPVTIMATVWQTDPVAPMLVYHKFKTNNPSTFTAVSRADFEYQLETLYQNGYVTIPVEQWLSGDLRVPEGKRPVILSMDDLFYRNQITLNADGIPDINTGLGYAWSFYQQYPDFGFDWALFSNMGDKPYGTGSPIEQDIQTAKVIAWCLENGAMIYNHTFRHANLKNTDGLGVTAELRNNDKRVRELLALIQKQDLIPRINNMISIPGGRWPTAPDSQTALYDYKDPAGKNVQAIFNVDFISRPDFIKAPYATKFNAMNLPRMVATNSAIDYIAADEKIPFAQACEFSMASEVLAGDAQSVAQQIQLKINAGECPTGIYATGRFIFSGKSDSVELLYTVENQY